VATLYELTEDFIELEARLDVADINDEALLEWMNELSNARQDKIDAYCWLIRKLEGEVNAAEKIEFEFSEKARSRRNKIFRLKDAIKQHMQATACDKLIGKQYTVALQKSGGVAPVNIDPESVPRELCQVKYIPDREVIRVKLERGEYVPGASLGERGHSVRIK
jgi:hypothetical protein